MHIRLTLPARVPNPNKQIGLSYSSFKYSVTSAPAGPVSLAGAQALVDELVTAARSALASNNYHRGDMADDYVRRLHAELAGEAALQRAMAQTGPRSAVGLAARLWLPVFAHEVSQADFESRWRSP